MIVVYPHILYLKHMIPAHNRLKHMKDFEILYKEGRFVGTDLVSAKIWKVEPEKYPRRNYSVDDLKIGFVVSLKVSKKAVERNQLKRQMREVVRLLLKEDRIRSGHFIAFMASPKMIGKDYTEIEQNVVYVLRKARVLQ